VASAQAAIDAINQYVTLVQQRNADIMKYNGFVAQLASLQAQINQNTAQLDQVQTAMTRQSNPALAPLVAFMARIYHDARAQVIFTLYMAGRSYGYWSLDSKYSALTTFIPLSDPTGITADSLAGAQQRIVSDFGTFIEDLGTPPQNFPNPTTTQLPQGITFVLTKAANPAFFDTFTTANSAGLFQVSFAIPAAFASTSELDNPFFSQANVRLTKVRPWIQGATTQNGILTVDITHTGAETIVDPDTNTANFFTHDPITKNFKFDSAQIFQPSSIVEDGDFVDPNNPIKNGDMTFALPGPFTTWTIQIDPASNTGLDMNGVDKISVEFWGTSFAFQQAG
jgi:hypothetical protein